MELVKAASAALPLYLTVLTRPARVQEVVPRALLLFAIVVARLAAVMDPLMIRRKMAP